MQLEGLKTRVRSTDDYVKMMQVALQAKVELGGRE